MLEINEKQLLSFNDVNKIRILKYIALGLMKFIRVLNEMTGINKETGIWYVLNSMKFKGISFESITRHRRKWIELHPEIKVKAKEKRKEEEQEYYLEYARR